jgi:hypothetical protein
MMDAPYRVVRGTYAWTIMCTGVGSICTIGDVAHAYLICELLNKDYLRVSGKPTLSAPSGSAGSPSA